LFSKSNPEEQTANEQILLACIDVRSRSRMRCKKHPVPKVRPKDKDLGCGLTKHVSKT